MHVALFVLATLLVDLLAVDARAEARIVLDLDAGRSFPTSLVLAADRDDDDEDGTLDADQKAGAPRDDLVRIAFAGATAPVEVRVEGALALWGLDAKREATASGDQLRDLFVQALAPSRRAADAAIVVRAGGRELRFPVTIAALAYLGSRNQRLDPTSWTLGISRRITHDRSLPRATAASEVSEDPENFRLELDDASANVDVLYARVEAWDAPRTAGSVLRHVPLQRVPNTTRFRSPFLRLVSDETDLSAPDVGDQLLRAHLRDRVEATVTRDGSEVRTTLRVGAAGVPITARSVLRGVLRTSVLRQTPGGPPVLGDSEDGALVLARGQVSIANEIWAQCFIDFGDPARAEVRVVDPPPPALLAVGDVDGLPARGHGGIVFRAAGERIGPIPTRGGALPEQTALVVAQALEARGLRAQVTVNPRTELGAYPSADVVVRDARGKLVALSAEAGVPLSSDAQQRVAIGRVDLSDGIEEFDNALASSGTLEERTLVKLVADDDPTTVDVILINRFVNRDRQGEAFIEADGSAMANVLVFDRNAVRFERQAWVQAHELGHVLLDEALHPDNVGPDRPWLLMDADARQGRITGPKRLSNEECDKARRRSGPDAYPPLLNLVR